MIYGVTPPLVGASDGAQVYWDKDGVREECGGIGGRRMPMDGGISGMGESSVAWSSTHKGIIVLGREQGDATNDACEVTHARKLVLLLVCMNKVRNSAIHAVDIWFRSLRPHAIVGWHQTEIRSSPTG
jgi:hypothetical protein